MSRSTSDRFPREFDDEPVIDDSTIEGLRELGGMDEPGILVELIDIYLDDANARICVLEQALREGDLDSVAGTAHALKSASANIGALPLSKICHEIEIHARDGDDVATLAKESRSMFAEVEEALRRIRSISR